MLTPITVSSRDFARGQKRIIADILAFGRPVVVTTRNTPRVAVVDLKTFTKAQMADAPNTARALLELAEAGKKLSRKYKDKYPTDLSSNLDKYAWGK